MPRPEPLDEIARRYRRVAHRLRSVLSQGLQLDGNLCDTIDQLGGPRAPPSRVRTVLSQLQEHARRSSRYHGELEALIGSMATQVTESLEELPLAKEVAAARNVLEPRKRMRPAPVWSALPLTALRMLLSNLCASDAAVFLWATGIQKSVPYDEIRPFLQYHRDIPLAWGGRVKSHLSHGHKILLVGSDVEQLHMRIHRPLEYWRAGRGRRTLQLWLATRISPQALEQLVRKRQRNPGAKFKVDDTGRVELGDTGGDSVPPIYPLFKGSLHSAHSAWTNWQTYDTDNRVRLMSLPGWPQPGLPPPEGGWPPPYPWDEVPRVRICPDAHRGGHVVQRWNGLSACNPIAPGTVKVWRNLLPGPVPPDFALPFIDLGTNQRGVSEPIEREPGTISIHDEGAAGLLFCVEFECCCNLVQFNHQVHGLWQIDGPGLRP